MKAASKYPRFAKLAVRLIIGVNNGTFFATIKLFPKTVAAMCALIVVVVGASFDEAFKPMAGALLGDAEYINQIVIGSVTSTIPANVWLSARSSENE
jgi:hypothetical protein